MVMYTLLITIWFMIVYVYIIVDHVKRGVLTLASDTVKLLFKWRFVAWWRRVPRPFADCGFVLINNVLLNLSFVWLLFHKASSRSAFRLSSLLWIGSWLTVTLTQSHAHTHTHTIAVREE